MKYLMTLLALVVGVTVGAQSPLWNPDYNADEIVGTDDLMGLLSVFGMEWEDGPVLMHIDSIQESDVSFDWYVYQYPYCDLIDGCNGSINPTNEVLEINLTDSVDVLWIQDTGVDIDSFSFPSSLDTLCGTFCYGDFPSHFTVKVTLPEGPTVRKLIVMTGGISNSGNSRILSIHFEQSGTLQEFAIKNQSGNTAYHLSEAPFFYELIRFNNKWFLQDRGYTD